VIGYYSNEFNIKFCVKLGQKATDTCAMLSEAYGGEVMKRSSAFERYKWFKEGREDVEDDKRKMWSSKISKNR
jgi:hypothetical protein